MAQNLKTMFVEQFVQQEARIPTSNQKLILKISFLHDNNKSSDYFQEINQILLLTTVDR